MGSLINLLFDRIRFSVSFKKTTYLHFLLIFMVQTSCAFVTTYNDLPEPTYPQLNKCNNPPFYYRVYVINNRFSDRPRGEESYRNENDEIDLNDFLKSIPVLPNDISPYPTEERGSFFSYLKEKGQFYGSPYNVDLEKKWSSLLSENKPAKDSLVLDIFINDHTLQYIHGTGTGAYGGMVSMLTLGIIPSWTTYDYEVRVKLTKSNTSLIEEESLRRKGSHYGSIFLYFHSRHHWLFSSKNPLSKMRERPLERIIGTKISSLISKKC